MPRWPCIELVDGVPCGVPSDATRCPTHRRTLVDADNRRRNAKTVAHGVKRSHFQRLRRERLDAAGGFCELHVDRGCTTVATTVHLDASLAGDHDQATLDHLRAACAHCHGVVDGKRGGARA